MTIAELRKQDIKELNNMLKDKNKEILAKRIDIKIGKEKNTSVIKFLKKEIAQINTVIREKEVLNEQ